MDGISQVTFQPAVTGFVFTPLTIFGCWLIHQIPPPKESELKCRSTRAAMNSKQRLEFIYEIWPGLVCILIAFFLTSSYRDFRDFFMVEILTSLGQGIEPGLF